MLIICDQIKNNYMMNNTCLPGYHHLNKILNCSTKLQFFEEESSWKKNEIFEPSNKIIQHNLDFREYRYMVDTVKNKDSIKKKISVFHKKSKSKSSRDSKNIYGFTKL